VSVEKQLREALSEVLDEAVWDLAQGLLHLCRELPVVVLLREGRAGSLAQLGQDLLEPMPQGP
jgi:hypothetical protein